MAKQPTRAQLAAALELANAEISRLKVQLEAERALHHNVTEVASSLNTMRRAPDPVALARKAAMEQAKAEAMRSGRCVKVSA